MVAALNKAGASLAGSSLKTSVYALEPQVGRHSRLFKVNFALINQQEDSSVAGGLK